MNYKFKDNKAVYLFIAALLALAVYYMYKKRKEGGVMGFMIGGTSPAPAALDKNKLLKVGVKGAEVSQLQKYIIQDGGGGFLGTTGAAGNGVDGDFGNLTKAGLEEVKGVSQITLNEYEASEQTPQAKGGYSIQNNYTGF